MEVEELDAGELAPIAVFLAVVIAIVVYPLAYVYVWQVLTLLLAVVVLVSPFAVLYYKEQRA